MHAIKGCKVVLRWGLKDREERRDVGLIEDYMMYLKRKSDHHPNALKFQVLNPFFTTQRSLPTCVCTLG